MNGDVRTYLPGHNPLDDTEMGARLRAGELEGMHDARTPADYADDTPDIDDGGEEEPQLEDHFDVRTHNGYITVDNPKTGNHRTYKVWTEDWGTDDDPDEKRVVAMLTGPDRDNPDDWAKFGFVSETSGVYVWNRFKDTEFDKHAAILSDTDKGRGAGLVYRFEGRCRACNRTLTNPVSIQHGIGPVCGDHGNRRSSL